MMVKNYIIALALSVVISGCFNQEEVIEGEQRPLRDIVINTNAAPDTALKLAAPKVNTAWTQRNGSAHHSIPHPSFSKNPSKIWALKVAESNKKRLRASSEPIVVGSVIYTLGSTGKLSAITKDGSLIWSIKLTFQPTHKAQASGGGLAYANGKIAVVLGLGEVVMVSAKDGAILWRHRTVTGIGTAPAFDGKTVVVMVGNNKAVALKADNGRVRWQAKSTAGGVGILGTGTPAIANGYAILPYSTGEVQARVIDTGIKVWTQIMTAERIGNAKSSITAISGDPVVIGNTVYLGTQAGRFAAFDRRSGANAWTVQEGAIGAPWISGNSIFLINDQYKLKRLHRYSGAEIWTMDLPEYKNAKRLRGRYAHYGPVLAGGMLHVAGSDGKIRRFDPKTGAQFEAINLPSGATSQGVVAGKRMYVLTENGQLIAYQ